MVLLLQVHLAPGSKFDFQKYIKRSLEDDFKVIVGIRWTKRTHFTNFTEKIGFCPVL